MTAFGYSSMHLVQAYDAPISLSIGTAWITRLMSWIYKGIYSASNYFTGLFFLIISIPIGSVLYLVVLYLNKRLVTSLDVNFSLDFKNCEKNWQRKVKLDGIVSQLKRVTTVPIEKESWYVKLFLKELMTAINAILLYHAELEKKFQHLDNPYQPLPPTVNVVTSDQLYNGRVKGYEYLV